MAVLKASFVELVLRAEKVECLFCRSSAELKDGALTTNNLLHWSQADHLIICRKCVVEIFPSIFADTTTTGEEDRDLERFISKFWRARAHIEARRPGPLRTEAS